MFTWSFRTLAAEHHLHDLGEEALKLNLLVLKATAAVEDVVRHMDFLGATVFGEGREAMRQYAALILSFAVADDVDLNGWAQQPDWKRGRCSSSSTRPASKVSVLKEWRDKRRAIEIAWSN